MAELLGVPRLDRIAVIIPGGDRQCCHDCTQKIAAQESLTATLQKAWQSTEKRVVAWKPGSREIPLSHNGKYWFGSLPPNEGHGEPKCWSAFGLYYPPNRNLRTAVHINIPTRTNTKIAGFFARDKNRVIYLMHDGSIGGGTKGVGTKEFLQWSKSKVKLERVRNKNGPDRQGIIIATVESKSTADDIARFVQLVVDFKEAVRKRKSSLSRGRAAQQTF
jgi:hypothetical protein